ncbi:MAG: glycosyltransferase [Sphingobium sp.]|nr:glycosyltransferase [Sphingobium sp.]MBP8669814.1 glycosyltransferase [Sphingobium sp.]MBP9156426.1 glycosyltransferase [Sphingobium sp.]MCC6482128.1 glycosyltransferase [Sphingomonadaceae bacterium]
MTPVPSSYAAPRVSVVVPHYNDLARLDRCLAALTIQTMARDAYEIIVADNNSPCGLAAVEAVVAGRAQIVTAMTPGAGPARNAGAEAAHSAILAFTDSDCVPEREWLEQGLAALAQADFIGGAMKVLVPSGQPMSGAEAFETVFAFDNERYVKQLHFTVTANLICPRELFFKVGPFRTAVSEDNEWCWRARAMGYRIGYAAEAMVGHPARANWVQLKGKWRRICAERYALSRDNGGSALRWIAKTWLELPAIPVHALRLLQDKRVPSLTERIGALGTLVGIRVWRFVEGHRIVLRGGGHE